MIYFFAINLQLLLGNVHQSALLYPTESILLKKKKKMPVAKGDSLEMWRVVSHVFKEHLDPPRGACHPSLPA